MQTEFCVYIHKRPDGIPFYVGKGRPHRAFDFAPSRRTLHHKNIVAKYGRDKILVETFPCENEHSAFAMEKELISAFKRSGVPLVNITDGGEGTAGHIANEKQLAGLAKGRGKDHFGRMPESSKQNIILGLARGREKTSQWAKTPEGKVRMQEIGRAARLAPRKEIDAKCCNCGQSFKTTTIRAKCCSRKCEQQYRRDRNKQSTSPMPKYTHSQETRLKMAESARNKNYTKQGTCAHCGSDFVSKSPRAKFCSKKCTQSWHNLRRYTNG